MAQMRRPKTSHMSCRHCRDDYGGIPPLKRSNSSAKLSNSYHGNRDDDRLEHIETEPVRQPRYYSTTNTQADYGVTREYGGYISARPTSRNQGPNNFYQRLTGKMADEPQTARRSYDKIPHVQMDGVRNKNTVEAGPPLFRAGRAGAPWRHIKQCIGNLGNHICFVDGGVKENDMKRYPPYGYVDPSNSCHMPRLNTAPPKRDDSANNGNHGNHINRYNSSYNSHAKQGFKYWHEDKPQAVGRMAWAGAAGGPKQTIQGRMMKMGIGY